MVEFTILALKRPFQVVGLGPSHQYQFLNSQTTTFRRRLHLSDESRSAGGPRLFGAPLSGPSPVGKSPARLVADGSGDCRKGVAQNRRAVRADIVDEAVAVGVEEVGAFAALDEGGGAADRLPSADGELTAPGIFLRRGRRWQSNFCANYSSQCDLLANSRRLDSRSSVIRDQAARSREPHDHTRWLLEPAAVNAKIPR
jgi:hypothetical protein